VTALIAWPAFHSSMKREGAEQIAAPAEPRTHNMHRANQSLLESADGSTATVATRQEKTFLCDKRQNSLWTQNSLDSDRPSHGRRLHVL